MQKSLSPGMRYTWHDAVYDVMVIQIPVAIGITFLFWFNALFQLSPPYTIVDIAGITVISILFCFLIILMFLLLNMVLLPPLFALLRFALSPLGHKKEL